MKLSEHLSLEQRKKFEDLSKQKNPASKKEKSSKKKDEKLSRADIQELMGTKRDIYRRVNGAIRRK